MLIRHPVPARLSLPQLCNIYRSKSTTTSGLGRLRLLLLATEEPKDGDGKFKGGNEPQTVLHLAGSLGYEATGDGADEGEGEGNGALIALRVLGEGREDVGVADEVAEQRRDDDGRHLGDAQAAAVHDLPGRLEGEQRDGRQLGEVDVGWVPP